MTTRRMMTTKKSTEKRARTAGDITKNGLERKMSTERKMMMTRKRRTMTTKKSTEQTMPTAEAITKNGWERKMELMSTKKPTKERMTIRNTETLVMQGDTKYSTDLVHLSLLFLCWLISVQ